MTSAETVETVRLADKALTAILQSEELRGICSHEQLRVFREAEREAYTLRAQLAVGEGVET